MKSNTILPPTIELTSKGVFQVNTTPNGGEESKKVAKLIRVRAIGKRDTDGSTFAQIRFRTIHGDARNELREYSDLLRDNWKNLKKKLANFGYQWPSDESVCAMVLAKLAAQEPERRFDMVSAPGWYEPEYVIRGQVFSPESSKPEIYIDPDGDAHVGAFVRGEGSLKEWQQHIAMPSRNSSCLRLSIAAALAAPFLRPLGLDSFGINWFGQTSEGKTSSLYAAASVAGLIGDNGLPSWADSEPAIEDLARGHRDCVMPLDDTGDGEHQMPLEQKARMLAFLIGRNRSRRLSKAYERNNHLGDREFRVIVLSTSERALGQIAGDAQAKRLGGEEVRFIDIPASSAGSSGIFDAELSPAPGKTLRQTTKEMVEQLRLNSVRFQGHAFRALMEKYVIDPNGLEQLRSYKAQFEREATLADEHNAHHRVQTNFAAIYAAAALAIDYGILPWKKKPTFRAIEKCMRLALASMQTEEGRKASATPVTDIRQLGETLKKQLAAANLVLVKPKKKATNKQVRARQEADGFKIDGKIYIKPDCFKRWFPTPVDRNALREQGVIVSERQDTATVERKIGGIDGKPRYYAIDVRELERLGASD